MTDSVALAPPHLVAFLAQHGVTADFHNPGVPMLTVASAAAAMSVPVEQILKTLLFVGADGDYVVAIAGGMKRIDRALLAQVSGLVRPRVASSEEVLAITGYPAGGVAPLGFTRVVRVIVDSHVLGLSVAYGGGGREDLLLRVDPADVVRLNRADVASILQTDDAPSVAG